MVLDLFTACVQVAVHSYKSSDIPNISYSPDYFKVRPPLIFAAVIGEPTSKKLTLLTGTTDEKNGMSWKPHLRQLDSNNCGLLEEEPPSPETSFEFFSLHVQSSKTSRHVFLHLAFNGGNKTPFGYTMFLACIYKHLSFLRVYLVFTPSGFADSDLVNSVGSTSKCSKVEEI